MYPRLNMLMTVGRAYARGAVVLKRPMSYKDVKSTAAARGSFRTLPNMSLLYEGEINKFDTFEIFSLWTFYFLTKN